MAKLRVVLDCNIYVRAFSSAKGSSELILRRAEAKSFEIFISGYALNELKDVVGRPEFQRKFSQAAPDSFESFLKRVGSFSSYIKSLESVFKLDRDLKDSHYIDLSAYVKADFLVTTDRDLLDLMTGHDQASKEFRQRFRALRIVRPDEFLRTVEANISLEL